MSSTNVSAVGVALGVFLAALGIINMKGNISSIRLHLRKRVTEENRAPFGKMVGMGRVIVGVSIAASEGLSLLADFLGMETLAAIGKAMIIGGIAVGMYLNLYAIFKYNKGIF